MDENFLVNAIKLFDRALLSEKLFGDDVPVSSRLPLADVMVRVMLDFLRGESTGGKPKPRTMLNNDRTPSF